MLALGGDGDDFVHTRRDRVELALRIKWRRACTPMFTEIENASVTCCSKGKMLRWYYLSAYAINHGCTLEIRGFLPTGHTNRPTTLHPFPRGGYKPLFLCCMHTKLMEDAQHEKTISVKPLKMGDILQITRKLGGTFSLSLFSVFA